MADYRRLVGDVLAATRIVSATSYTWFGTRSSSLSADVEAKMTPETSREYLIYNLQAQLYADFYCAGAARLPLQDPSIEPFPGASPFVHALSEANAGRGAREPGWTLVREEPGALVVERGGLSLWAAPTEVYPANGAALVPGSPVGVLMPKELLRLSPGFYMALGEAELPVDGSAAMVRFYWNLRSDGAALLIGELTRRLNREGLAFRLKVVSDPGRYSRCDAGVLYVLEAEYRSASIVVADVYRVIAPVLKPVTPALTKMLAPGLAMAEDPSGQLMSFGMSRCGLLAAAIVEAAELGLREPLPLLTAVEQRFAEAGIDIDAPYLNPGSTDRYGLPLE